MSFRQAISASLLINEVKAGHNKVNVAMIHPSDQEKMSQETLEQIKITLKVSNLLPSDKVERGWLYVDSQPIK